ncbi:glycoside hydrolase family 61 protein [Phellopilus nigrolimitatus]|nr:glycoside hydrolase family 61 protein [Phellopilus nigrolimitatus]
MKSFVVTVLAFLAGSASAHTIFQEVYVNGLDQGHLVGIRAPDYNGPITNVSSDDLICNGGPNPLTHVSPVIISALAGSTGDPDDPIASSHKGPVISYLAAIPNATQSDVTDLKWFKIWEDGLDTSGAWGVDRLIANEGKVTFTLPSCIPAGQYLLRHEIIALHVAESYPGAQFYMECAQLEITGGGSTIPATVSFPGAYAGSDPGITINIYQTLTNYTIPGASSYS